MSDQSARRTGDKQYLNLMQVVAIDFRQSARVDQRHNIRELC